MTRPSHPDAEPAACIQSDLTDCNVSDMIRMSCLEDCAATPSDMCRNSAEIEGLWSGSGPLAPRAERASCRSFAGGQLAPAAPSYGSPHTARMAPPSRRETQHLRLPRGPSRSDGRLRADCLEGRKGSICPTSCTHCAVSSGCLRRLLRPPSGH